MIVGAGKFAHRGDNHAICPLLNARFVRLGITQRYEYPMTTPTSPKPNETLEKHTPMMQQYRGVAPEALPMLLSREGGVFFGTASGHPFRPHLSLNPELFGETLSTLEGL